MKSFVWVVIHIFLLLGCGDSGNGPSEVHYTSAQDLLKMQSQNIEVSCQDGDCPTNVGFLIIKKNLDRVVCTFSLVSETVILTNEHCLPDELKQENALCGDDIIAVLIDRDGSKEFIGCDAVESLSSKKQSDDDYYRTDYAFLRLSKRTNRTPFIIENQVGVQDKEVLTSYVATPKNDQGKVSILIEKKICTVHMNSQVHAPFNSPFKSVIVLKGCTITQGNSGSALIGSNGKIKGVLQVNFDPSLAASDDPFAILVSKFAIGTNATCFENRLLNLMPHQMTCDMNEDRSNTRMSADHIKDQVKSDIIEILDNLNSASDKFIFSPKPMEILNQETTFEFLPFCIKGKLGSLPWLEQYKKAGVISLLDSFPESVNEDIQTNTYSFTFGFDEDARPEGTFESEEIRISILIPVKFIAENLSSSDFSIEISYDSGRKKTLTLPLCND